MRQRQVFTRREPREISVVAFGAFVAAVVLLIVMVAWVWREYRRSIVITRNLRTSLSVTTKEGEVGVVSFDPSEENITEIILDDIEISSRSVGKYKLSHLYRLGEYEGEGGEFVKKKIQGFLRLPMADYLVLDKLNASGIRQALWKRIWGSENAEMSKLDAMALYYLTLKYSWSEIPFENLVKEGAVVKEGEGYLINNTRLLQFVGNRFFDWAVGAEGTTVTVVNETEIDGLGNDVATFLTNVGMDVIAVRSGQSSEREQTMIRAAYNQNAKLSSDKVLKMIFGSEAEYQYNQDLTEYRSDVVVTVGKNALEMY